MAGGNKKTYTLKINGIKKGISDATTLEEAIDKIGAAVERTNKAQGKAEKASKAQSKALSDEEKAAKKLAETKAKLERANSEENRKQIEATQALRERTREITREIKINSLAEGSVKQMGMQLTDLRNEYEALSEAERENIEVGGAMLERIQALDEKYKQIRESTGNFRDSVGNYEKAVAGIDKLGASLDNMNNLGNSANNTFSMGLGIMGLMGMQTDKASEAQQKFQKILALVALAVTLNNDLQKKNNNISSATALIQGTLTTQATARVSAEAAQGNAIAATTIKQRIFNAVANAHPLVLLMTAILTVVGGYALYSASADSASASSGKYSSALDGVRFATKEARDQHDDLVRSVRDIQVEIDLARGKITEYQADLLKLANANRDAMDEIKKEQQDAIAELNEDWTGSMWDVTLWQAGQMFKGRWVSDAESAKEYKKAYDAEILKINKTAEDKQAAQSTIAAENEKKRNSEKNAEIIKQNEDLHDKNLGGYKATYAQIERERARALGKALSDNAKIAEDNKKRSKDEQVALNDIAAINKDFDNQRDATRKSENAERKAAGEKALKDRQDVAKATLDILRQLEDDETSLISDEFDRRRAEVKYKYERQVEDLRDKLATDKTLTAEAREAIGAIILNSEKHIKTETDKIANDEIKKREEVEAKKLEAIQKAVAANDRLMSRELQKLDVWLNAAFAEIDEVVKRRGSLQLIDAGATRDQYKKVVAVLGEYIAKLREQVQREDAIHAENLANLKQGSTEYEEELARHATVVLDLKRKITQAGKDQADAQANIGRVGLDAFRENAAIVAEQVQGAVDGLNAVFDTASMGLQLQVEALQEQLAQVSEKYEETKQQREAAVENIKELELAIQEASGGTRDALREQLQNEMHDRAELEREEARLAKEKEKREKEIKKKEKQMKRVDIMSGIAQGVANTAVGVTKALGLMFPLNFIVAGLVGAMGAVQTGIMSNQLAKLEDGGLINAPRHSQGGARIQGTNIEVEGDEYVINRESTAKNMRLVEFVNNARREVTAADLVGIVPNAGTTVIVDAPRNSDERILAAIDEIEFRPVVAVTDINDVNDNLVEVRDLAGFK